MVPLFGVGTKVGGGIPGRMPLSIVSENSLLARWQEKRVLDSLLVDDMESFQGWSSEGVLGCGLSQERVIDGGSSVRFSVELRDTIYYGLPENRTQWGSFSCDQGGYAFVERRFDTPQDWSQFNRLSFWVYIEPHHERTSSFFIELENRGFVYKTDAPQRLHFIQDLEPGRWHRVYFEMPHLLRNRITGIRFSQFLIGHSSSSQGKVTYNLDRLMVERVAADSFEGWEIEPGAFSFSHVGYRPNDEKIVLSNGGMRDRFVLVDSLGKVVYRGMGKLMENKRGRFRVFDFSDFKRKGRYRIGVGNSLSKEFVIDEGIWDLPLESALNFYFCQRCGFDVPGIHEACHLDWRGFYQDEERPLYGGWHDAADLSQGFFRTAMGVYALLSNRAEMRDDTPQEDSIVKLLDDEIAWGMEWLRKTRFSNGYHASWSVMRIYTDNVCGTIDDVRTPASKVIWEKLLGAALHAKAYLVYRDLNPEWANVSLQLAREDWTLAVGKGHWVNSSYLAAAWGATASALLFQATGEDVYKQEAIHFGGLILRCQETRFLEGIPIAGYFYRSTARGEVLESNHGCFEEAPLLALVTLCECFPSESDFVSWYAAATYYSEFFLKRGSHISAPFNYLPSGIYRRSDLASIGDDPMRESALKQYHEGTFLNENYVLRTFPIWDSYMFHGGTTIQLSKTWALAAVSALRKDREGMTLVGKQLQWVFGQNPFVQSLMYGVGYNFPPHFAYCLRNIVGSLPVGMDSMRGDLPYWSASVYATYKEIWIEPVNRFMGALSLYRNHPIPSQKEVGSKPLEVVSVKHEQEFVEIHLLAKGEEASSLEVFSDNLTPLKSPIPLSFTSKKRERIVLRFGIEDCTKPYLVLLRLQDDREHPVEVVGHSSSIASLE